MMLRPLSLVVVAVAALAPCGRAQSHGWAPPKCDLKAGHFLVNSGVLYLKNAAETKFDDQRAKDLKQARDVLVVSGASSVPCLTAALIDAYLPCFARLDAVDYGISAAQHTNRGRATTSAVLSYVGKPMTMLRGGRMKRVFGWEDTHAEHYPELGWRLFGNCDIPDLTLFPARYPTLRSMRFAAGHELKLLHLGTRALGALVRLGFIRSLDRHAFFLLRLAFLLDPLGSGRSGLHMILTGTGHDGRAKERRFHLIARSGHGPYIPCMPAILLARQLARGLLEMRGATPCLDLIDLDTYLNALDGLDISIVRDAVDA